MDVLKNKSYRSYERLSRYATFPYAYNQLDDKYVYFTTASLDDTTSFQLHQVERGDNFDSLALKYYGNPTYYWIILDFNRIQDPFMELKEGIYIKIPLLSTIEFKEV